MNIFNSKYLFILFLGVICFQSFSQPVGYYNGTEEKSGEDLKLALHQIINNHVDYSYYFVRDIINYSDADPDNENNVILFYLQESRSASEYGTGGDDINREHVWAKSHGFFGDKRPMDSDAFNLRPADASVNQDRYNYDFDNVQPGGQQHSEATTCWYTDSTWEPGPQTKGQVARILFYMATRYEGTNGEMDLELVTHNNTYPKPEFGNLNTLLDWNNQYPPSDFERRRNERLYRIQQNRNPFVDNPEFANYIWNSQVPSGIIPSNFLMTPNKPSPGEQVQISIELFSGSVTPDDVKLFFGKSYDSEDNQSAMVVNQSVYSANINLPNYQPGDMVYFKVELSENQTKKYLRATYLLPKAKEDLTIIPISDVQGNGEQTPLDNNEVSISGRVVANFDGSFYIQNGEAPRSGVCIYGSLQTGNTGDSLVITGTATEYSNLTELTDVSYIYNFENNKEINPIEIPITGINEDYEGMLVRINGVDFSNQGTTIPNSNKTYSFSNNEGSSVIFSKSNSRLVGNKLPSGSIDLVGIVGQYRSTYQILPRDINDFILHTSNLSQISAKDDIVIYPNPARLKVNISTSRRIKMIYVYDLSGRVITFQTGEKNQISIDRLPPGVYLLGVSLLNDGVIFKKLIKPK